jgi:hypothetical protein
MKKILVFVLFLIVIGLSVFTYLTITKNKSFLNITLDNTVKEKSKSHVGCSDIREVVEENGKYYIACYGGVVVMDKTSGKILSQITMDKGLSDFVTTGLILKGNTLYIGTQDGLTIWDLIKNTGKKLSVNEGLPNGANILLKEDGKYIWIGTFDGLARLNTENNQLETFRKELTPYPDEKINVSSIAITKNYVYFSIVASARSSGFIARYNKNNSNWDKFNALSFNDTTEYARVDAFGLCSVGNGIVFTEDKTLWTILDQENTKPLKIFTADFNDSINMDILCSGNSVLFNTLKSKLVYTDDKVRPFDSNLDSNLLKEYEIRKNKTDFTKVFGDNNPGAFFQMLGVIDDNVYLATFTGFWVYNAGSDKLTQITIPDKLSLDTMGSFIFWPVEGSNKYVLSEQTCGMGCEKPLFYVCTYPNNQCSALNLSSEANKLISPPETAIGEGYGYYGLSDYEKTKDSLKFKVYILNKVTALTLNAKDLSWKVENEQSTGLGTGVTSLLCTNESSYRFKLNNISSDWVYCIGKEKGVLVGDYYYTFNQELGAVRVNKNTSVQDVLSPKMTKADYTPFEDSAWDKPKLSKLVSVEGKVYYATNRGLWILDTSKDVLGTDSWSIVSIDNGLLSNDILNFIYVENKLFVLTSAGITLVEN